jgi:hypothetical protein
MTDGLKASQIKGGIRPSKSFDQGRVCKDESCKTQLSIYNKRDYCFNHAPVNPLPDQPDSHQHTIRLNILGPQRD